MGLPLISTILDVVKAPLERLIPDKNERRRFEHDLELEVLRAGLAQMEINKAEARHTSIFVAGWRPFVGWVCGMALGWHFMGHDVFNWLRLAFFPHIPAPPQLAGTETLMTVLLSMLGLGGLRTVEKLKGVSREKWRE
ncbi:3TM-type holin [Kordiimonas sp.]|uniref:3TM-type holin n=1 Tax=Kordiimonas sp. TaxID=1970157 RepID=UPI003A8CDD9B